MEHGSIITQARREDALVLTKQGLVSKSSPKKPRGRNIFKALFCCFRAQHVGQSSPSTELSTYKEEANTIAKGTEGLKFYHTPDSLFQLLPVPVGDIWKRMGVFDP
uniref:CTD small phosphatase 2 n=1 Tax=Equus asinus TaxID=9793 RepID=A0A9L0KEX7_EQUAS